MHVKAASRAGQRQKWLHCGSLSVWLASWQKLNIVVDPNDFSGLDCLDVLLVDVARFIVEKTVRVAAPCHTAHVNPISTRLRYALDLLEVLGRTAKIFIFAARIGNLHRGGFGLVVPGSCLLKTGNGKSGWGQLLVLGVELRRIESVGALLLMHSVS